MISVSARTWSSVSTYGNESSSSFWPGRVGLEGITLYHIAPGIQIQHLLGDFDDGLLDASLFLLPLLSTQTVECRDDSLGADIACQPIRLVDRDVELPPTLILHRQELTDQSIQLTLHQPAKPADAVVNVNDKVVHLQIGIDRLGCFSDRPLAHTRLRSLPAEDFRVCDQVEGPPILSQEKPL